MPAVQSARESFALQQQVGQLYAGQHQWLHGWLRKKLGCAYRAADLTHDTFVQLLAGDTPVTIHEPRAFLTTVARRLLFNHYRREQIERAYLDALAALPGVATPSPEERAILLEALCEIDRLLDGLPAPVRRAFLYAQLDGLSHAEIAERLSISVTTVKRYLVRALTQCFFAVEPD